MVAVALAGLAAGSINAVVGSGTLVTFPVLLAVGLPPVTATVTNSLGLVPGNLTGAIGYRRELTGQRRLLLSLLPASVLGALSGAFLLLHLPAAAFETVVPGLVALAVVLVAVQPLLHARGCATAGRPPRGSGRAGRRRCSGSPTPPAPTAGTSRPARACCRSGCSACCSPTRCSSSTP